MALPSSGQISLGDIYYEINGVLPQVGDNASLRSMSSTASKTTPDAITEFYGYSHGSAITVEFESTTTIITDSFSVQDGYRGLVFTGRQSGDQIDINLSVYTEVTGSGNADAYYRKNGGAWVQIVNTSSSGFFSVQAPNITSTDTVDIRVYAETTGFGSSVTTEAYIDNGTFDSGSGTITVGTPRSFSVTKSN